MLYFVIRIFAKSHKQGLELKNTQSAIKKGANLFSSVTSSKMNQF